FELELHRAECEFLTGEQEAAEVRLAALSSRARSAIDQATVTCLRIEVYTTLGRSDRAMDVGLDYLRHLGVESSPESTKDETRREYERMWSLIGGRSIEDLVDLPLMSDPQSIATMEVLTKVAPPVLLAGHRDLFCLILCWMVNLSLERGNTHASTIG